jgi:tRNA(Ile)-lysidine synthase
MDECKYSLVAVSGGSDSMALLDKLYNSGKNLVVCHVNYNVRDSALRDENIVRSYCQKKGIILEILKGFEYDKSEGNFENWARVIRYNFFKVMYKKYNCDCLYVGHNLDDLLETYFIQKERKGKCDFFGLKEDSFIYEMNIKRVLLEYSKEELRLYCENNDIDYGVDETNFDEKYLRNNIRHNVIKKMSIDEKKQIVKEINFLNVSKEKEYKNVHALLNGCKCGNNTIDLSLFRKIDDKNKISVIYYFVIENVKERISISEKRILDVINKINSNKPNIVLGEFKGFVLYKEYERLVIKKGENEFSYIIKDLDSDIGMFEISDDGRKLEKLVVSRDLFPLTLESYKGDDKIINRLFIDKKVPISERKCWPIVKDKLGRVLLVLNIKKFYNIIDSNCDNMIEFYIRKKRRSVDE